MLTSSYKQSKRFETFSESDSPFHSKKFTAELIVNIPSATIILLPEFILFSVPPLHICKMATKFSDYSMPSVLQRPIPDFG